jgi:zinc transport system substrate-binding protein
VCVAAANIAGALAAADPAHAAVYRENLHRFEGEIEALDRFIHSRLDTLPRRRFWVYHPAWGYFAAEYGLEQIALEEEGKEAGPARLVEWVERARREGVRTLFVQQGFSDKSARLIAGEIGARLVVLDPLAYDWPDNLRRVTAALEEALSEDEGRGASDAQR